MLYEVITINDLCQGLIPRGLHAHLPRWPSSFRIAVDGVTSTALFVNILREIGLEPVHSVPKRSDEGVGLSLGIVNSQVLNNHQEYDLVVSLDCGSNDTDSIQSLVEHGVDVIIIDHHQIRGEVHPGAIIVNPHLAPDEENQSVILCSVVV